MAISREEAQQMVNALEQAMSARINAFVMSEGQPIKDSIDAHVKLLTTHNDTFYDLEGRISRVVQEFTDSSKLTATSSSGRPRNPTKKKTLQARKLLVRHLRCLSQMSTSSNQDN